MGGRAAGDAWPAAPPADGPGESVWRAVGRAVESAGERALWVFDADGTLWDGDLGEVHLDTLADEGLVKAPEGFPSAFAAYRARCELDASEGYAYAASMMGGMDVATARASAERAWARHRGYVLAAVRALFDAARSRSEVWIVSASNRFAIEAAAQELGLAPERVIAMTNGLEGERLLETIRDPRPNGAGKVRCIETFIGRRPTVAVGNSIHDAEMLDAAELGVLVRAVDAGGVPEPWPDALASRAARGGWLTLDCPLTPRAPAIVG
ncbi:MAG: haloacid dehalogenase-like hydrolase [Deltaproteobacteria bacterium]|nr:haloacid dehalogenase-like hydrolase [Deltaproteobacteria bacterium]MCB9786550.1 haloacid dehalogenase-like hydrolase [Deltaproteobacteria bacterium]